MAVKKAEPTGRLEQFASERPDGTKVIVTRDLDTGEQTVEDVAPAKK